MTIFILLLSLVMFSISSASLVTWVSTTDFNSPISFKDNKLPCSRQTVVFPESVDNSIVISTRTSVKGFVLPTEGEIILDVSEIEFGADTNDSTCSEGNVYYINRASSSWAQPDVWQSERFNEATPDSERIPCYDDVVEFPEKASFTIVLPDRVQEVKGIIFKGRPILADYLPNIIYRSFNDETQRFILNKNMMIGLEIRRPYYRIQHANSISNCDSVSGCPCQAHPLQINCAAKFCPKPACLEPIKPKGNCCKICGGALAFNIEGSFSPIEFKELVERIVDSYGSDSVVYHIGRLVNDEVQLVVVDKGDYVGTSAMVVNDVSHMIDMDWVKGVQSSMLSGSPLSKEGLGGKIAVSMFFVVLLVMGGIYAYYYQLPKVQFPLSTRDHRTALSRFQRRTDSVVTLTRRDSNVSLPAATSFRNPLYDSKRGRVEVVQTSASD